MTKEQRQFKRQRTDFKNNGHPYANCEFRQRSYTLHKADNNHNGSMLYKIYINIKCKYKYKIKNYEAFRSEYQKEIYTTLVKSF